MKKLLVFLLYFFLFISKSFSATYYIRTDGGTALQCNGKFDLSYPGEGENQNCA